jgi:hypothetical protein
MTGFCTCASVTDPEVAPRQAFTLLAEVAFMMSKDS